MDPTLAAMYGTNTPDESDLEKMAAAELADGLAGDFTEDDLEEMAQEVLGGEVDENQEKLAEADYLGRVMAHSYVQELRGIEKEAATAELDQFLKTKGRPQAQKKALLDGHESRMPERSVSDPRKTSVNRAAHTPNRSQVNRGSAMAKDVIPDAEKGSHGIGNQIRTHGKATANKVLGHLGKHKGKYMLGAGGLGAIGAGLGTAAMLKKSSAMDTLVEQRAAEILEASGIDPETFEYIEQEQEKVSGSEVLADAVEQRAWELLAQHGFEQE